MKPFFFFLFLLLQVFCKGQDISIAGIKNLTVYVNNHNSINVTVKSHSCKSLIISTDNGLIKKENSCWYQITPKDTGTAKIVVKELVNNKAKLIGEIILTVKDLDPIFLIGPSSGGEIQKTVFAGQEYARAESYELGCVYYYPLIIDSFKVTIIKDSVTEFEKVNLGNKINDELKRVFQNLMPNDTVLISNIKATGPDKKQGLLKTVSFIIK